MRIRGVNTWLQAMESRSVPTSNLRNFIQEALAADAILKINEKQLPLFSIE